MKNQEKLIKIIVNQAWLMEILSHVRDLDLPDWYVAAGTIRNTIWNYLHGYDTHKNQNDIDVVYFDPHNLSIAKEKESEEILKNISPHLIWEVKNQARKNPMGPQVGSACRSIAFWSETPTCVGVRLENDNTLTICAPHGLDDLFNLVVRPIPKPYQRLELYQERIKKKQWDKIWPKLRIERKN